MEDRNLICSRFDNDYFIKTKKILIYIDKYCTCTFKLPVVVCYIALSEDNSIFNFIIFKLMTKLLNLNWELHFVTKDDIKNSKYFDCNIIYIEQGKYKYIYNFFKKYDFYKELSKYYENGVIISGCYYNLTFLFKNGIIKSFNDSFLIQGLNYINLNYEDFYLQKRDIYHYRNEKIYDF